MTDEARDPPALTKGDSESAKCLVRRERLIEQPDVQPHASPPADRRQQGNLVPVDRIKLRLIRHKVPAARNADAIILQRVADGRWHGLEQHLPVHRTGERHLIALGKIAQSPQEHHPNAHAISRR